MKRREKLYWHIVTKAEAVWFYSRGRRGVARVLWRWMANLPTEADMAKARAVLARPEVRAELERLTAPGR